MSEGTFIRTVATTFGGSCLGLTCFGWPGALIGFVCGLIIGLC